MVFQDPTGSLNRARPSTIVAEGLRMQITPARTARPRSSWWGARSQSGLRPPERFYLSYPHELRTAAARGDRRRTGLDPEVIVADEPVSNLDASVRGEILQLLMQFRGVSASRSS